MKKFYVYEGGDDHYIDADQASITQNGELIFLVKNELVAGFPPAEWNFFKEVKEEKDFSREPDKEESKECSDERQSSKQLDCEILKAISEFLKSME